MSAWLMVARGATNSRRVADHRVALSGKSLRQADGRHLAVWLPDPVGPEALPGLAFIAYDSKRGGLQR